MDELLRTIQSPNDLKRLSAKQLRQLAEEMRQVMCRVAGTRTAHFASNLGVIELTLALHTSFDFARDRLVWDTGHQVYPHKMVTGRYQLIDTIRTKGGIAGFPNPAESPYDLFQTGHAGCAAATALGLCCGDELLRPDENRYTVAVVGDGAFSSGIVFEAMNHAGGLKKHLIVVLNDNKMSIGPRVGGLGEYLDRLRMTHFYRGLKSEIQRVLGYVPVVGDSMERFLEQVRDAIKAGLVGGMLFEEIGFHYLGPVDGHNIRQLQKYLQLARDFDRPVLLHVVTKKGYGHKPAEEDPVAFHAPSPYVLQNGTTANHRSPPVSYTRIARDAVHDAMRRDPRVATITAAMCEGNMLEPVREDFPDRFFDVGICESHAVAFAAGLARSGMRPIVDIYSTFLQRAYDQIFQEVSLQNLPVLLMMDRAGLVGADGPTHHGVFDLAYLRPFPNLVVMAPGDGHDLAAMVEFALALNRPAAIRYPKAEAEYVARPPCPIVLGRAEMLRSGSTGTLVACGTVLGECLRAADRLGQEGLSVGVINARFVKPLDRQTLFAAMRTSSFVLTVEEGVLAGGFGSAVLEAASEAGLDTRKIHRLGIPDSYIEHAPRKELLRDLGLDEASIVARCRELAAAADRCKAHVANKPLPDRDHSPAY